MSTYVGIDVSKHRLDVALAPGAAFQVRYDETSQACKPCSRR
jgi:hypothetical protein